MCTLPPSPPLQLNLTETSRGFFGARSLPAGSMRSVWYQRDADKLLRIGPTPGSAGLSDYYFNASGFFLHTTPFAGTGGKSSCSWLSFCAYECEVYNYDSRFLDYIGTWRVSWKRDIGKYNTSATRTVRAYAGNAIDAAGVFPVIAYISVEDGGYAGLDKITPAVTDNPDYAYYWYTVIEPAAPDPAIFRPPSECHAAAVPQR